MRALRQHFIHQAAALLVGVAQPTRDLLAAAVAALAQAVGAEPADADAWRQDRLGGGRKKWHLGFFFCFC